MNEYAFPRPLPKGEFPPDDVLRIIKDHAGMQLRDWFAGMILQSRGENGWLPFDDAECAAACYRLADAMLAERAKKQA